MRYKIGPGHRIVPLGNVGYNYCAKCGLVLLKNEVSRKAARKACRWDQ